MPHSFPITVVANNHPTKLSIKPPPMICDLELTKNINERIPVPTPPLSSTSPMVELAPIIDFCIDNRPPSPESPKAKRFIITEEQRPSPLEPVPQFNEQKEMFPLCLFEPLQPSFMIPKPTIQIPIPRRHHHHRSSPPPARPYQDPFFKVIQSSSMSPTMAAASASAAASAAHRHPGSQVAANLLKSIQPEEEDVETTLAFADCYSKNGIYKHQSNNVDQSMFLTKNSHIKRPRNAWIHFRCHYGQALKIQDPTLRAEEISKRASQRWSKLSENEKKPWHGLAEQEKLAHREAFPEYRYCPRRATPSSPPANKRPIKDTPLNMHDDCKKVKRKTSK
ncbi:hypothetical protein G6F43_000161 [Rhizopus delemar]|nr:hypothetical protein G6F43_000161 [Rhizopus delemar]